MMRVIFSTPGLEVFLKKASGNVSVNCYPYASRILDIPGSFLPGNPE
jgi:hypothetical protein